MMTTATARLHELYSIDLILMKGFFVPDSLFSSESTPAWLVLLLFRIVFGGLVDRKNKNIMGLTHGKSGDITIGQIWNV